MTGLNSGNWSKVGTRSVTVSLDAGVNSVRLSNATAWMPDMDYMKVELLEADGIEQVTGAAETSGPSATYDLSGRRHTEPTAPGLYVIGGQKKLIR